MRAGLLVLLPIILPIVIFLLWRASGISKNVPHWLADMPWVTLSLIGLVLGALTLGIVALTSGGEAWAPYHPPKFEHGRIVPGGFDNDEGGDR